PIDQLTWAVQARMTNFESSGEIVFVGSKQDLADPAFPNRREDLARAIDNLSAAGAAEIYVDVTFERASSAHSDAALNHALRGFGDGAHLVSDLATGLAGQLILERSTERVGRGVAEVGGQREFTFLGYVWDMPYAVEHEQLTL